MLKLLASSRQKLEQIDSQGLTKWTQANNNILTNAQEQTPASESCYNGWGCNKCEFGSHMCWFFKRTNWYGSRWQGCSNVKRKMDPIHWVLQKCQVGLHSLDFLPCDPRFNAPCRQKIAILVLFEKYKVILYASLKHARVSMSMCSTSSASWRMTKPECRDST